MGNVSCNYTLPCIPPVGHHPPPHTTAYSLPLHDEIKTLESMVTQLTEQNRDALEVLHRQAEEVSELRRSLEDFRLNDSVGTEARAASEARAGSFTSSARRSDNSSHRHRHQPSSSLSSSSPLVADATVLRGDYYGEQQRMKPNEDEDMHNVTFDNDENNMTAGAVSGASSPDVSSSMALFSPLVGGPTPMRVPSPEPLDATLKIGRNGDAIVNGHGYDIIGGDRSIRRSRGGNKDEDASSLDMPLIFARGTAGGGGGGGGGDDDDEDDGSVDYGFGNASKEGSGAGYSYGDEEDEEDEEATAAAEEEERLAILDAAAKEHEDEVRTFEVSS